MKDVKYIENIYLEYGIRCSTELNWYENYLEQDFEKLSLHLEEHQQRVIQPTILTIRYWFMYLYIIICVLV